MSIRMCNVYGYAMSMLYTNRKYVARSARNDIMGLQNLKSHVSIYVNLTYPNIQMGVNPVHLHVMVFLLY